MEIVIDTLSEGDDEVNWLECISAIETDQGLIYFCDASYAKSSDGLHAVSDFTVNLPEGTCFYSITGNNPLNKVTNRLENDLANHKLLCDLRHLFPCCKIHRNFSYFPGRPYHFERGYTILIPSDYKVRNHGMIIYSLAVKYEQAAFFRGVVMENGLTIPNVVLVQGEYTELQEKLVSIKQPAIHPAFLHATNNAVYKDLSQVLNMLYQFKDHVPVCSELYTIFKDNFAPGNKFENYRCKNDGDRHPVISIEGSHSEEMAVAVGKMLGADYYQNTPECLRQMKVKVQHSSVLQAAFKTIADYIQASLIAHQSTQTSVIVRKYWSNTAASLIASEIHKGQSNLPPKYHSVYQWPDGLLKPDVVVFLLQKSGCKTGKQKLKDSALKRMSDDSWIHVGIRKSKTDVIPTLVVDKLHGQGITCMRSVDPMCPASDMPSQHSTLSENNEGNGSISSDENFISVGIEDSHAKPFWW